MQKLSKNMWIFLIPFSIVFFVFLFIPLIYGIVLSLASENRIIGLTNYVKALNDPIFQKALINTCVYILGNVFLAVVSLLIAILMREIKSDRITKIYETLMIFPYIIPMVVTGIIFKFIFQPQVGLFSGLMRLIGLPQYANYALLSHSGSAKIAIIITWVFVYAGYMVNIYISSLKNIPASYYEAAEIDGASMFQRTIYITLPLLSNIFVYTLVTGIILSFQIFPLIWILTGSGFGLGAGGPDNSTLSIDLYVYQTAFREYNVNLASAMGIIMMIITYVVSQIPMRLTKEVNYD